MQSETEAGRPVGPVEPLVGHRYTSAESRHMKLPTGFWWENVAPLGSKPRWMVKPRPEKRK